VEGIGWLQKEVAGRRLFFSSFKRWLGKYVSSVKFENIRKELVFKVAIAHMFLAMNS
jgi:hypothetical protein